MSTFFKGLLAKAVPKNTATPAAAAVAAPAPVPAPKPIVVIPSAAFAARVDATNAAWLADFWKPRQYLPPRSSTSSASSASSASSSTRTSPTAIHVFGTSIFNIPQMQPIPFSHRRQLMFTGQRALEPLLEAYNLDLATVADPPAVTDAAADHSHTSDAAQDQQLQTQNQSTGASDKGHSVRRVGILINETEEEGAWLIDQYTPLIQPFFDEERKLLVAGALGSLGQSRSVDILRDRIKKWASERDMAITSAMVPSEWHMAIAECGLVPQWDTVCVMEAAAAHGLQRNNDEILKRVAPTIEMLDFVALTDEQLEAVALASPPMQPRPSSLSANDSLENRDNPQATVDLDTNSEVEEESSHSALQQAMMDLYSQASQHQVPATEFGQINTGTSMIDAALQRLVLDADALRNLLDLLAAHPLARASAALQMRLAHMAASAANLELNIQRTLDNNPDLDVLVVVADRSVAAILTTRLSDHPDAATFKPAV